MQYRGGENRLRYIFVDFEMNPIDGRNKEIRKRCKQEIMEIGAVMLDETYTEIDEYKTYVKPEYNEEITKICSKLTGITMESVSGAPCFKEAIMDFIAWCQKEKEYKIFAWSENDLIQLTQESELKKLEATEEMRYMIEHWCDFQKEFCNLLGLYKPISLETAIGSIGKEFQGQIHDAVWDARNTAEIYRLSKDEKQFKQVMKPIIDLIKPQEDTGCSLGEIFDFSQLTYKMS